MRCWRGLVSLFGALSLAGLAGATDYYVDSQSGSDTSSGLQGSPWKSLARVNAAALTAGDRVLFQRGGVWRGQVVLKSGNASGVITYTAGGSGAKPRLLGSVDLSDPARWTDQGGNLWTTEGAPSTGPEGASNPSFDADLLSWGSYANTGDGAVGSLVRTTTAGEFDSSPAGARFDGSGSGTAATSLLVYTSPLSLQIDQWYVLQFRAKASTPFTLGGVALLQSGTYAAYADAVSHNTPAITTAWATYRFYFHATQTASDAMAVVLLGNALPAGQAFFFDTVSFKVCAYTPVALEAGNLIFNYEAACGTKMELSTSVTAQGDFWYDNTANRLTLYSAGNPASYYSHIECALNYDLVSTNNTGYAVLENLDLRYAGAHGVNGHDVSHLTVRDCDFSYIGGGQLFGYTGGYIRYGNAVQFWENAHDCTVERCRIDEIYDTGVTAQGAALNQQYNLYVHNNLITRCQWSLEFWNQPAGSQTSGIYLENNTCLNAGGGWSFAQRPDKNAAHLALFANPSQTDHLVVRDNLFADSRGPLLLAEQASLLKITQDYNLFHQSSGNFLAHIFDTAQIYTDAQLAQFGVDFGGNAHSVWGAPLLDAQNRPTALSPAVDAGQASPYVTSDFAQTSRPQGARPDIGAYELIPPITPTPTLTPQATPTTTATPTNRTLSLEFGDRPLLPFPNPAGKVQHFALPAQLQDFNARLNIYNAAGEQVAVLQQRLTAGKIQILDWDCRATAPGIYRVMFYLDDRLQGSCKTAILRY